MAQKHRFLISHNPGSIPFTLPISFTATTSAPSTPSRKRCFYYIHFAFIFSFGGELLHLEGADAATPPHADSVHFIFQILQTFVIIHFLLLCVHSINVIYEADFAQKVSFIVRFWAGRRQKSHRWRKLHGEDYDVVGCYQKWVYLGKVLWKWRPNTK